MINTTVESHYIINPPVKEAISKSLEVFLFIFYIVLTEIHLQQIKVKSVRARVHCIANIQDPKCNSLKVKFLVVLKKVFLGTCYIPFGLFCNEYRQTDQQTDDDQQL